MSIALAGALAGIYFMIAGAVVIVYPLFSGGKFSIGSIRIVLRGIGLVAAGVVLVAITKM
jgi:hypothetical protein